MFCTDLYNRDLIAFGTGKIGKKVIPFLAQDPTIRLIGVTNSRIGPDDEGTFLRTGLPLRTVQNWAKIAPDATILVTASDLKQMGEIVTVCREAGFQEIIPIFPYEHVADSIRTVTSICNLVGDSMVEYAGLANEIHETHMASFSEFKACHRGQTVAVVGAGPTLNYYTQVKGVPHIGLNGVFRKEQLNLDYYFLYHYSFGYCEKLKSYSFVKFFAYGDDVIPECAVEENHARRFFVSYRGKRFDTNIEYYPMAGGHWSLIFPVLQFAVYTRPKRILLVGCDCSDAGQFIPDDLHWYEPRWLDGYIGFKDFIAQYYPDIEIMSVNPVGLKGMFHDVYTENYLDAHPELDRAQCEILDPENLEGE